MPGLDSFFEMDNVIYIFDYDRFQGFENTKEFTIVNDIQIGKQLFILIHIVHTQRVFFDCE